MIKWESGKLKKIPVIKLQTTGLDGLMKQEKNRETMRKLLVNWKNNKKKNDKVGLVFILLIEWMQTVDIYCFKGAE